jgi:serine/threonine-protein kinase
MPDRWRQVEDLYHRAIERENSERSAFLAEACAGDEALRREVESLLGYQEQAEPLLQKPALVDVPADSPSPDLCPAACFP